MPVSLSQSIWTLISAFAPRVVGQGLACLLALLIDSLGPLPTFHVHILSHEAPDFNHGHPVMLHAM